MLSLQLQLLAIQVENVPSHLATNSFFLITEYKSPLIIPNLKARDSTRRSREHKWMFVFLRGKRDRLHCTAGVEPVQRRGKCSTFAAGTARSAFCHPYHVFLLDEHFYRASSTLYSVLTS